MSRRGFIGALVAGLAAACTKSGDEESGGGDAADSSAVDSTAGTTTSSGASTSTSGLPPVPDLQTNPFTLGVASGDPLPDSVILWTRLAPDPMAGGGMPGDDAPVVWEVFEDESDVADDTPVQTGTFVARSALAHSVHIDVGGLAPDTWYRYRFRIGDWTSPVGRTRTAPLPEAAPDSLKFAFASCQHWESGQWTAYPHVLEDRPDIVVFLGDYIYEYAGAAGEATPSGRNHQPEETETLDQYRNRYALYKSDERLRAVHEACPWVMTWDDHEVQNNYAGEHDEAGSPPAEFNRRRAAAYQAFYEHLPLRVPPPDAEELVIYRSVGWGALAEIMVLDTRQYRSDQVCGAEGLGDVGPACDDYDSPEHVLLGKEQEDWLHQSLIGSGATWKVLANQMVFAPMPIGTLFNNDQWDGYPNDRERLIHTIVKSEIDNVVVITGDIHSSGAADVPVDYTDPRSPIAASEFVGTSISSGSSSELEAAESLITGLPWVKFVDSSKRGYVLCTLTADEFRADFRHVDTVTEEVSGLSLAPSFVIRAGTPGMAQIN